MPDTDSIVPLAEALFQQDDVQKINRELVQFMFQDNVAVICISKKDKKQRKMPFKSLYDNNERFWQQAGSWEYFITKEELSKVIEKAVDKPANWEKEHDFYEKAKKQNEADKSQPAVEQGYGKEAESIFIMSPAERVKKIDLNKQRLNELSGKKSKDPEIVTEALVETTKDAAIINHAALLDAIQLADDEAKKFTQDLVSSTCEMVKASTQLISEDILNDDLLNTLVEKSNGTIVQHMTRVFLNGISFLDFYNKLVTGSSLINKLRVSFSKRYGNFYCLLLPHIAVEDISLERIFYQGMRAVPPNSLLDWAVGFLVHDIGKASAVEYHEGESAYNREIVIEHVKLGYTQVMNKTNYPKEAGLITGYHHEYFGDSAGYGYFRSYLEQYKKSNPNAKYDYCISYDIAPMLDHITIAYFPAKVLEIIDVYDSVTDPNRKYHKAMSSEEALAMMREQFIIQHHKIDPIIFDIFELYIRRKKKK